MAFNRRHLLTAAVWLLAYVNIQAQTVYYPVGASQLLKSTADDIAKLLQRAVAGSHITAQSYTTIPATGIVLIYDDAVAGQICRVKSNGSNFISFAAREDNGLNYGVYEYLHQLGFRFYQPGTIWEITPTLSSPFTNTDTLYSCRFKYKNWFISGGYSTWAMDNSADFFWDTYYGELGHQWSLYQRRNNMVGAYRFAGHRDDILTEQYLSTLQNNPCYVASHNGSRAATRQSVPDINNIAAMQLWESSIENQYTNFKNTIFNNTTLYKNYYRNFSYWYGNTGIEVPDGANWANTTDNMCGTANLLSESDQHFTLANFTAEKINTVYPGRRFQLYAYDGHADVPSSKIVINQNVDVQVVPTAFQFETSAKGLLKRWYERNGNISEYHYLNLPQWSGETPSFFLNDLRTTVERLKEKQAQGIVWEAAASKFASLPFLMSANRSLINNESIENGLQQFCSDMFGNAAATVFTLLQNWSSEKVITVSNGTQDNKYKLPFYFQLVKQAEEQTQNDNETVKQRINELKAYLHYMVLYYNWVFDQRNANAKTDKADILCMYLARINRMQLVNSYFLINDVVRKYAISSNIFTRYNVASGTAYLNGLLPSVTKEEINNDFINDYAAQTNLINRFAFKDAAAIKALFEEHNLLPLEKINVQVGYTNGKDYTARSEYYLLADKAGSFFIKYTPKFDIPGKGYINFTVEAVNDNLGVIKDISIDNTSPAGNLNIAIPGAGIYKLSIISKYKSSASITISTNGNYFYKNGPFLGNTTENYRGDLMSLPGYFYVPPGMDKIYFSLNNSNPGGAGHATAAEISRAFAFKDNNGISVEAKLNSTSDSALFYLEIPQNGSGFWQSFKMEQYRLCFANTSNIQWYAKRKECVVADFKVSIKANNEGCITQLSTPSNSNEINWEVYDAQKWYEYKNIQTVELPATVSPNAIVTLRVSPGCYTTRRIGEDEDYIRQKTFCATGATPADLSTKVIIYPNPGSGIFKCMQNGQPVIAEQVSVFNSAGLRMTYFNNTQQFNISNLPAGMYFYTLVINKITYKGKLVKM